MTGRKNHAPDARTLNNLRPQHHLPGLLPSRPRYFTRHVAIAGPLRPGTEPTSGV